MAASPQLTPRTSFSSLVAVGAAAAAPAGDHRMSLVRGNCLFLVS